MKRVSKAILICLAAVCLLGLLFVLALNLYVQSPGTQARIERELSQALKLPLVITNTSLTPWSALRINGIAVPGEKGNFLEASSFSARYRLLPLLRKKLIIYDMRFENPRILWTQNEKGKWKLPKLPKAPEETTDPELKKTKKEKSGKDDFQVVLNGFSIVDGMVDLLDKDGKRVAQFHNVDIEYKTISEERIDGIARIGRINYADALFFENLQASFEYASGRFTLPTISGALAGGSVDGSFELAPEEKLSPFVAQLKLQGADVGRLSNEAGWASGRATGTLDGSMSMAGPSRDFEKVRGEGELQLKNGTLRQMELLQTLGEVLQFEELIQLRINSGHVKFQFADERIEIDRLVLESPDLKLSAVGNARFNKKLDLDARLSVDERTLKRRAPFVRQLFGSPDENGEHGIEFKVAGTIARPKTDLAEKLLGRTLGDQFENIVSRIFGLGKKKDEEKEKKDDEKKKKKKKDDPLDWPPVSSPTNDLPPPSPGGRPFPSTHAAPAKPLDSNP